MKFTVDSIQEKKIRILFGAVAFLGGVTAILVYFHQRKLGQQRKELIDLEMKVKKLQLKELEAKVK